MEESENLRVLDVDYIFDNFDSICDVEFGQKSSKMKGPSIIRNLSSTFEKIADSKLHSDKAQTEGTETDTTNKRAKSKSKSKPLKPAIDKVPMKDETKNQTLRKQLRLNLEDLFAVEPGSKPNHTVLESTRSKRVDYSTKANLMKFLRSNAIGMNNSQLPKPAPRKPSITKLYRKQGSAKAIHSAKEHGKLENVFGLPRPVPVAPTLGTQTQQQLHQSSVQETSKIVPNLKRQIAAVAKQIKRSSSKQSFGAVEGHPLTGSTRIHTTSRQGSAKHRSRSLLDTDQKHQILVESTKNLHSTKEGQLAFPFHPGNTGHHQQSQSNYLPAPISENLHLKSTANMHMQSSTQYPDMLSMTTTPYPCLPGTPDASKNHATLTLAPKGVDTRWKSQVFFNCPNTSVSGLPETPHGVKIGMFTSKNHKLQQEGRGLTRNLSGHHGKPQTKPTKPKKRQEGSSLARLDRGMISVMGIQSHPARKKVSASVHLITSCHQAGPVPNKDRTNSKCKYYIPAQLRFKSTTRAAQNESQKKVLNSLGTTFDEGVCHQNKSSYLYKVMFPKVIAKGLASLEPSGIKSSSSAGKRKPGTAVSKDKTTTNIASLIMNMSKKKKPGYQSTKNA